MYTGTMIEELIQAVANAEELAKTRVEAQIQMQIVRQPAPAPEALHLVHNHDYAYVAQMVGVA